MPPPEPRRIAIPSFTDARGTLCAIEWARCLTFEPQRCFHIFGVPPGATRGGHANRYSEEFIMAVGGSFTLTVDDGSTRRQFEMDSPADGVHVPPLQWVELSGFSAGAICAVLASMHHAEDDILRDYPRFLEARRAHAR